jgi:hypothetical protein
VTISDTVYDALFLRLYLQLKDGTVDREVARPRLPRAVVSGASETLNQRVCLKAVGEGGVAAPGARGADGGRERPPRAD